MQTTIPGNERVKSYGVQVGGNLEENLKDFHRMLKGMKFQKYLKMLEQYPFPHPKIMHSYGWFKVNPGYLLGTAG